MLQCMYWFIVAVDWYHLQQMERNGYVADEKILKRKKVNNNDRQEEDEMADVVVTKKAKEEVGHF